jgi:PAS domain S-box-containing protein
MDLLLLGFFQVAVDSFLALLLGAIYLRLYREEHLKYWALSWASLVLYIFCGAAYYSLTEKAPGPSEPALVLRFIVTMAGSLQAPLVALAAISLRGRKPRTALIITLFAISVLIEIAGWSVAIRHVGTAVDPRVSVPRFFLTAAAMAWFAFVFPRRRGLSSETVTALFCLAYAVHEFVFGLSGLGIRIYSGYLSAAASLFGAVLPLGITMGIVFAVIQDAKSSSQRMSRYWDASLDGMALIDDQGTLLKVNDALCRIIGKARDEIENQPFIVCVSPSDGESLLSQYRQVAARRQIKPHNETPLNLWDGNKRWFDVTAAFVKSEPQDAYLVIVRDITSRKETENAWKESDRRFRDLFGNVKLAGVILNTAGSITYCNNHLLQITGWRAEEVLGKDWFEVFIPPQDRDSLKSAFARLIAGDSSLAQHENSVLTRQGDLRLVQWTNALLHDPAGLVIGSASLGADSTEHRQLEERYRQAQKLESVGRLAGGIAHDFNNLLTVINGYSELLLGTMQEQDPLHDSLEEIMLAGQKAAALTQQLLAFSRKQVLQPKLLDVNAVIGDASRMLRRLIEEDVELITHLDPSLGPISADEGQIHQVLMNLAVNARDAMPNGGKLIIETAKLEISDKPAATGSQLPPEFCESQIASGPYVLISLADTGTGMSEETKSHLFEPFFTTKEQGKGTGLGLSTVYGIVHQSGGHISVSSRVGKGTTFHILLPSLSVAEVAQATLRAEQVPRRGTETILLVEDQAEVRKIAAGTLRNFGYEVLEAASGEEAVVLSEGHHGPIHLMVTDVVMPGMTGPALAKRLKGARLELRVLYMSGYTDRGLVEQSLLESETAYIQKPFTPQGLAMKVGEFLGQDRERVRILVVDDELSIRMLFRKVLERAGYEVVEAANGKAAMSRIREGKVSLIITDLVMPEQEGVETIRQLRQTYPQIKVIAMSGAFGGRLLKTAELLGAQATLMKPVSPATILQVTQDILRK